MNAGKLDFPKLYLELVDSTRMIAALLAGISQEEARIKPNAESWSVLETVCHLHDEERLDFRPRLEAILTNPSTEWKPIDPEGWVTAHRYNEQNLGEIKERFFAERGVTLDWLKGLEVADWDIAHTASFGTISAGDMFASWVAHDNLAIRQLVELRRARLERITKPFSVEYAGDW